MKEITKKDFDEVVLPKKSSTDKGAGDSLTEFSGISEEELLELEKQYYLDRKAIQETFRQAEIEANKKAEKVMTLDALNFQLQNLQYLQKNLSDKSDTYTEYAKK